MISHDNIPIVITNLNDTNYDNLNMETDIEIGEKSIIKIPVIKIPRVDEEFSYPLNLFLINKITKELGNQKNGQLEIYNNVPFINPSEIA